jgi:hypothetical protein
MRYHSQCGAKAWIYLSIALLLSPLVASAGPLTLYTDREAFLAAANPDRLLTFDEPTFGIFELIPGETPLGPTVFPQVRFDLGDVQVVYREPGYDLIPNPLHEVLPANFIGVTVTLPDNTYAVGVDLLQAARTGFIIGSGATQWSHPYSPPECGLFEGTPPCEAFTGFVGFISADDSVSIPSFSVSASPPGFLSDQALPYSAVLDNLMIQVPEPTTALLLAAGLIGVCWRGRKAT